MSVLNRLSGGVAGIAIGGAASDAISPILETVKQTSWGQRAYRVLAPTAAAEADVRGIDRSVDYADDAKRQGVGKNRYLILRDLAETRPGVAQLLDLWRRDGSLADEVKRALRRQGYSEFWSDRLMRLRDYLAPPSDLIRMAVREAFNPAQRDFLDLDAEFPEGFATRAEKQGISREVAGDYWAAHWELPSYGQAAQMLFRGELTRQQFRDLLKALDYAPTWRGPLETIARSIPTITDFQRLVRRGVYGGNERSMFQYDAEYPAAFTEKMALHGMNEQDARDLWAGGWRMPSAGQLYHMLWRGEIDDAQLALGLKALDYPVFWRDKLAAIARPVPGRIDLRRMYQGDLITRTQAVAGYQRLGYTLADAQRLVALASVTGATTSKGLTAADLATEYEGLLITRAEYVAGLREIGYDADAAEAKADVTDNKREREARNALIATARTRYIGWRIDQPAVEQALQDADVPAAQASDLLARWTVERELNVHHLSEAQVLAAYKKTLLTRDAAMERLLDLGLDATDALIRLGGDPRNLSVTDIVKAYVTDVITRDDAIARLVALGFTAQDAAIRLDTAKA